ncbi:hypothetical protein K458DRAFT_492265 [Lentithecium fluviatile CBS 122367]|uniref:Uncharacterized protein n=1 Tax=Lentithecium fluviatile CBS 122367 TaxID=1168545 RepID=A0A6G1IER4_9PLEO|nr:hypothetical protein K458DRAFT_492265 [Lentithecium fluviatile CBS 122367]
MNEKRLKGKLKRTVDRGSKFQLQGPPIGVPDAATRCELYDSEDAPAEEASDHNEKVQSPRFDMKTLLAEAGVEEPTTPTEQDSESKNNKEKEEEEQQEYDPTAPHLDLPALLQRIERTTCIRAERDATKPYIHNHFFIDHVFGNAPYTFSLCKRCTRRRKCGLHREVFQQQTSISLCSGGHVRMNLYWAVDDPVNTKGSWQMQIKEYFDRAGAGGESWARHEKERETREHDEECRVYSPSERVRGLAERVLEDMEVERIKGGRRLRGNVRRVVDEVGALLGGWERVVVAREIKLEKERKAREEVVSVEVAVQTETKKTEIKVGDTAAQPTPPKTASPTPPKVASPTPERASIELSSPKPISTPTTEEPTVEEPTLESLTVKDQTLQDPPNSSYPIPSPTPSSQSTPSTVPNTPPSTTPTPPVSPPSSLASLFPTKRKQSSAPSPSSPPKKSKKVHWAVEIETSQDAERPRILSPEYVSESGEGRYSPAASEDEVAGEDETMEKQVEVLWAESGSESGGESASRAEVDEEKDEEDKDEEEVQEHEVAEDAVDWGEGSDEEEG